MKILHTKFPPDRSRTTESTCSSSFIPQVKCEMPPWRFSWNPCPTAFCEELLFRTSWTSDNQSRTGGHGLDIQPFFFFFVCTSYRRENKWVNHWPYALGALLHLRYFVSVLLPQVVGISVPASRFVRLCHYARMCVCVCVWMYGSCITYTVNKNPQHVGGHGYLSVVIVVCCQVEVSATNWSLVQRSPTDCGASLCVI